MKKQILTSTLACTAILSAIADNNVKTVKDHFKNDFLIGAAIPVRHVNGEDAKADSIVSLHFNSIVAENCMKNGEIQPKEGEFFWDDADKFVKYGEDRNMAIIGHALVWHSQLAPWFPKDKDGNDVSPEVLKQRMKDHIYAVVGRYKGKIKGWDVVNEAIEDDGSYRKSHSIASSAKNISLSHSNMLTKPILTLNYISTISRCSSQANARHT